MKQVKCAENNSSLYRLIEAFFYGNYFYGICVVSIMLETSVQLNISFNGIYLYALTFVATILFYNYPYARKYSTVKANSRIQWYISHHDQLVLTQIILTLILLALTGYGIINYMNEIKMMSPLQWFLFLMFPFAAGLYYGADVLTPEYNLRKHGFLKPFVIGFVWAGVATVYPLLFNDIIHYRTHGLTLHAFLLFMKNFMYVSLLAIMFDIKDYSDDSNANIETFVVKIGLSKTIFFLLLPLTFLGILTFLSYAMTHHFSYIKMSLLLIPFFALIAAAISLRKRRSFLYYLIIIDGLFVVKAIFGIVASFM